MTQPPHLAQLPWLRSADTGRAGNKVLTIPLLVDNIADSIWLVHSQFEPHGDAIRSSCASFADLARLARINNSCFSSATKQLWKHMSIIASCPEILDLTHADVDLCPTIFHALAKVRDPDRRQYYATTIKSGQITTPRVDLAYSFGNLLENLEFPKLREVSLHSSPDITLFWNEPTVTFGFLPSQAAKSSTISNLRTEGVPLVLRFFSDDSIELTVLVLGMC